VFFSRKEKEKKIVWKIKNSQTFSSSSSSSSSSFWLCVLLIGGHYQWRALRRKTHGRLLCVCVTAWRLEKQISQSYFFLKE
jgi:hypothetical protein